MRARTIGRWVGRATLFAALGLGLWAVAGLASVSGVSASVVTANAPVQAGSDLSGIQSEVSCLDFEWS